jgi:putative photosynthetic complex assembly protein 2
MTLLTALAFAVAMWFTATGLVVWLDRLPRTRWPAIMVGATVAAGLAMGVAIITAGMTGAAAAYLAFACGLTLWAWHELAFLFGYLTGPNRAPCPDDATGWRRFRLATATLIHHEVAVFGTLLVLALATWGQPNQTATMAFALLFALRISAKFNIFTGVPHLSAELLPDHLGYLASYFRVARPGRLFAISIAGIVATTALLARVTLTAPSGLATGYGLACALTLLGLVEHLFLVVPWRDTQLFAWANKTATSSQRNFLAARRTVGQ